MKNQEPFNLKSMHPLAIAEQFIADMAALHNRLSDGCREAEQRIREVRAEKDKDQLVNQ